MCIAAAIAGSAVVGGIASNAAAKKQAKGAKKAAQLQYDQYAQTREDQMPFLEAGYGSLARLNELLGIAPPADSGTSAAPRGADFGKYGRDFAMSDFESDPGYAFRLSEGMKALDRQAAARGGLMSGGALKAAQRFGQDLGSQEYQNAFNRYQVNRANQLTPLQSMAGQGQTTAAQLGQAGQNYATNAGNAYGAAAQAQASGYMGAANAIGQGVGQYMGYQSNNSLLNALSRSSGGNAGAYVAPNYAPANYGFGSNVRLGAP